MSVQRAPLRGAKLNGISRAYLEISAFNYGGNDDTTPPGNFEYFLDLEEKRHRDCYLSVSLRVKWRKISITLKTPSPVVLSAPVFGNYAGNRWKLTGASA